MATYSPAGPRQDNLAHLARYARKRREHEAQARAIRGCKHVRDVLAVVMARLERQVRQ
jgi:hypothetical protein